MTLPSDLFLGKLRNSMHLLEVWVKEKIKIVFKWTLAVPRLFVRYLLPNKNKIYTD